MSVAMRTDDSFADTRNASMLESTGLLPTPNDGYVLPGMDDCHRRSIFVDVCRVLLRLASRVSAYAVCHKTRKEALDLLKGPYNKSGCPCWFQACVQRCSFRYKG